MKIAIIKQHGSPDSIVFEDRPVPEPVGTQVLVRVKACGLNHLDTWVRRGVPGHKFPLPIIPGCDIAGVVKEVGSVVRNAKAGDRVVVARSFSLKSQLLISRLGAGCVD